jgi:hypothetical protein
LTIETPAVSNNSLDLKPMLAVTGLPMPSPAGLSAALTPAPPIEAVPGLAPQGRHRYRNRLSGN